MLFNLFKDRLSDINLEVYLSTGKILYSLDGDYQYQFSDKEMNVTDPAFLSIQNIIKEDGDGTEGFKYLEGTSINNTKIDTAGTIKDDFNVTFGNGVSYTTEATPREDDEGNKINLDVQRVVTDYKFDFNPVFGTGSTDMGDLSGIIPSVHPYMPGAVGICHGNNFYIENPELACVGSAKVQLNMLDILLILFLVRSSLKASK